MAILRRRYGRRLRRRFRRRNTGVRRPRYRRYLRKKRGIRGRRRSGGTVSKLLKSLLPTVPFKYVKTYNGTGTFASRTYFSEACGNVQDAYSMRDYLPNQSNIYDDGTVGTSTHLTFQQFYAKKFKLRHQVNYTGQNVANTNMFLTVYICKFRRDYTTANPSVTTAFLDNDSGTTTGSGGHRIDSHSSLAAGYIGNYHGYPQYNLFMSPTFCSQFMVLKKKTFKIPPGGWFKFKMDSGWNEFDNEWLNKNAALAAPIRHLRNWSKYMVFSWHGELVQKTGDIATTTLSATDFIMYGAHTITAKAVPYNRKSIVLAPAVNLDVTSPLSWTPVVRPKAVIQVNATSTSATDKG